MLKDHEFLIELGLYFRDMRKKAGLSQLEVSKRLGYGSAQFVSNWERGLASPPIRRCARKPERKQPEQPEQDKQQREQQR